MRGETSVCIYWDHEGQGEQVSVYSGTITAQRGGKSACAKGLYLDEKKRKGVKECEELRSMYRSRSEETRRRES